MNRQFIEEETQETKRHIKTLSNPLAMIKMQIKQNQTHRPIRLAKIRELAHTNSWWSPETACTTGGNTGRDSALESKPAPLPMPQEFPAHDPQRGSLRSTWEMGVLGATSFMAPGS